MATVTERDVHVNGIDLHLAEAGPGSGPPVVLLHGFPESCPADPRAACPVAD